MAKRIDPSVSIRVAAEQRSLAEIYVKAVFTLTLAIVLASFVRVRGQGALNISIWIFLIPFVLTLVRPRLGLLAAVVLLTVAPALHLQVNELTGMRLYGWAYPGTDACLGFLLAWSFKGQWPSLGRVLTTFPSKLLIFLHAWMALSALVAVGRNVWQSASEFSFRGLVYNVWLTRGISWLDDYYPVQDLFFYSAALAMLFAVWAMLLQDGHRTLRGIALAVLGGVTLNALFAVWQKSTGLGWVDGDLAVSVNALWPDLHSFGALMATGLFLGYGLLRSSSGGRGQFAAIGLSMMAAAVGLFLSTSRSTLVLVVIAVVLWAGWATSKTSGWRRALPFLAIVVVLVAVDWALHRGYRGHTYDTLGALLDRGTKEALSEALSNRPAIWRAAIELYLSAPLFGLGQGVFYRLSGLAGFSPSDALKSVGGNGAHNYFLQTFVELGPVALIPAALILIPCLRLGRRNFGLISFYALLGIAVGNVFAHALLVRETLMLCAVFCGAYCWESQALGAPHWRPVGPKATRVVLWSATALALLAFVEVARSLGQDPFKYGQVCFESRALAPDGWTGGVLRQPIPVTASSIELEIAADRLDLVRRSLTVEVSVSTKDGTTQWLHTLDVGQSVEPRRLRIELPQQLSAVRLLNLKTSHCFVPLNLGLTYDPRRLGVRVVDLRFRSKDGSEVK